MRQKSILLITNLELWSMGGGSGAPSLANTVNSYLVGGYQVYVLSGNKTNWEQLEGRESFEFKQFDCPGFKKLFRIKKLGFFAKALWWLWFQLAVLCLALPLLLRKKIDLIYGYELMGVPVSYFLARLFRLKVVSRFQGSTLCFFMGRRLWRIRAWDHILALRLPTDLLIMTDDGQRGDQTLKLLRTKAKKIFFWRNGVNKNMVLPGFNREEFLIQLGLEPSRFVILSVSRLNQWKRVDRIIRALPEIIKVYSRIQLLIVGAGELRFDLEADVERLGLSDYVYFIGAVPQNLVNKYLQAADLFVSLYDSSNVGNPLLEAMCCGKCILTLNNGSTGELIKNNYNGILLELEELPELPQQILRLIKHPELRTKLGSAAREYAENNFWTWEVRMEEELKQVEFLLAGR